MEIICCEQTRIFKTSESISETERLCRITFLNRAQGLNQEEGYEFGLSRSVSGATLLWTQKEDERLASCRTLKLIMYGGETTGGQA